MLDKTKRFIHQQKVFHKVYLMRHLNEQAKQYYRLHFVNSSVIIGQVNTYIHMGNYLWRSQKPNNRIAMIGMGFSGKTTILNKLSNNNISIKMEILGFTIESISYQQYEVKSWDLWSGVQARIFRIHYRREYEHVKAIVFVVSAAQQEAQQLENAKKEFDFMLGQQIIRNAVILILVTKLDLSKRSLKEIEFCMNLQQKLKQRTWDIKQANGNTGQGIKQAFDWLEQALMPQNKS